MFSTPPCERCQRRRARRWRRWADHFFAAHGQGVGDGGVVHNAKQDGGAVVDDFKFATGGVLPVQTGRCPRSVTVMVLAPSILGQLGFDGSFS